MTIDAPIVAVEIPLVGDHRRKHWAKVVHSVDASKSSGWAYVGDFIADGGIQDVRAGSVVIAYGETGSRANPHPEVHVYRINADATTSLETTASGRAWARTIRDTVQQLVEDETDVRRDWDPDITTWSDDALAEELARRGWSVRPPEEDS